MKISLTFAAFSLASLISFSSGAATLVTEQQVTNENMQPIGTITVSGLDSSPMTIREALSDKADKKGASAYRVVEDYMNGNYHATAEIYK